MPGDRDHRVTKTPPEGVRSQLASKVPKEDWSHQLTPVRSVPSDREETPEEARDRRIIETKNCSIDAVKSGEIAISRIDELRKEYRADLGIVHEKIDGTNTRIDEVNTRIDGVFGKVDKTNELLISVLQAHIAHDDRIEEVQTTKTISETEIHTKRQVTDIELEQKRAEAQIEDTKQTKALKIRLIDQAAPRVFALLTTLATAIASGYGIARCGGIEP